MEEIRVKVTGKRDGIMSFRERDEMLSSFKRILNHHKFISHHISVGKEKVEEEEEQVINPVHDVGAEDAPHAPGVYEAYVDFLKSQY